MPKENIYNRYFGQFAREASSDGEDKMVPLDDSILKIGWTKDQDHVEVAILRDSDDEVLNDAWHFQFDRPGIQRAIQVLRKARDDAWGKDA